MTVSEYVKNLLKKKEDIEIFEIDTDHVNDGSEKYGLYRSPGRTTRNFNDGSYEITENYQFMAKQSTNTFSERKETDEWLEELSYWADDFGYYYQFPELGNNRTVTGFSITGSPYLMEADSRETLYQMSLSITYIREREDL